MKIIMTALCFFASMSHAGTITITSSSTEKEAFQSLPQTLISVMKEGGLDYSNKGNGIFTIGLSNYHCDYQANAMIDTALPDAGVERQKCRKNSENVQNSTKGQVFRLGRSINQVLNQIEAEQGEMIYFTDCGMGYCGTFAKEIDCTIDTKIDVFSDGRFSCQLIDGN